MKITNDIVYIGVNDHQVDLFEGQYVVPNGMAYNSYVILDEKIAVMDTVDNRVDFCYNRACKHRVPPDGTRGQRHKKEKIRCTLQTIFAISA